MERSKIKIAGSLVLSSLILLGSVWASPAEARGFERAHNRAQQVRGHKQRPQLVRMYRNHRGEIIRTMRPGRNHFGIEGYYVRRNGHYYWVSGHRSLPPRYWKRAHRRGAWDRGPMRRVPRTVIIEREVEVERETPSIQIGPEELSVIIPLPW